MNPPRVVTDGRRVGAHRDLAAVLRPKAEAIVAHGLPTDGAWERELRRAHEAAVEVPYSDQRGILLVRLAADVLATHQGHLRFVEVSDPPARVTGDDAVDHALVNPFELRGLPLSRAREPLDLAAGVLLLGRLDDDREDGRAV